MESGEEEVIKHYGIIRRSGRYPYGSGNNAYQDAKSFQAELQDFRDKGLSDTEVARAMGIKTPELRANISIAKDIIYSENKALATRLSAKGVSTRKIAERMLGDASKESTVRGWLKTAEDIKENTLRSISNLLKRHQAEKEWVDVGKGNELYLGVSETRFKTALAALRSEGYETHLVKVKQLGTDKLTELKVLGPPGSTWKEAKAAVDAGLVYTVKDKSKDGGLTFLTPKDEPVSVSSKRIEVRYSEDGGSKMDGVIELRRGVPDLDLGANRYAQVRVAVDGTHYLKGMAIYADDLPAGTDIRFNSAKSKTAVANDLEAMKPLKEGPENAGNRFGATTRPMVYQDKDGKTHTSALNIVNEEGNWNDWSRSLSSQMLSKQSVKLASSQLAKARAAKQKEFDDIMALTNPIVKKQLLMDFAQSADSASVHLKAASLDRQSSHAILPVNSMRPTEVYAPNFNEGEKVALIRYPHAGPFEIPVLTVNNRNREARRIMGGAEDAIGIHHTVAEQLSGADFDGDSVLVIPNDNGAIKSARPLSDLKNFDPKSAYPSVPGMRVMTKANTQKEMGKISNLITDMSLKGASDTEIARAVRHSMVVIDAEKKELNYKQSEKDNGIAQLKKIYQGGANKGASTIISRSSAEERIPQQRLRRASEGGPIDPKTGGLVYVPTGRTYTVTKVNRRTGETYTETKLSTTKTTKGEATRDAFKLTSGEQIPMEEVYAAHSNSLKALANEARKEAVSIKDPLQSKAAKAYYASEVASLKTKLKEAQMNAPLERRAQVVANATAKARIDANPGLDKDDIKKIKYQSLSDAREQTGAAKQRIGSATVPFTQREWDAIQAGAVSSTTLREILANSNMDRVKELATPKYRSSLSTSQLARIKSMSSSGRGLTEIAEALGIPRSTIADNLKHL